MFVSYGDAMTQTTDKANQFFERYAAALLARDEAAIAGMYAIPSLILFPGNSIPVSDARQTEEFFAASWEQYEGVDSVDNQVVVMAEAPGVSGPMSPGPTRANPASASATSSSMEPTDTRSQC